MAKRLGRGYGSGKGGHTTGRGQKGQKSRGGINILFQGLKVKKSTLKKLPLLRGRGKFAAKIKPVEIKIQKLSIYKKGDTVTMESLIKNKLITQKDSVTRGVKIIGKSEIKKDLNFQVPVSK